MMIMIPTTKVNTKKLYKVFHKKTAAAAASAAHDDDYGGWCVDFTWSLRGIYEFLRGGCCCFCFGLWLITQNT